MEYETEEQQVEALKEWWQENGRSVILGVVIGAAAIFGWQGWGKYQLSQSQQASDAFSETLDALAASATGSSADLVAKAENLKSEHGGSLYAVMASLAAARALIESGDLAGAAEELQWAIDKSSQSEIQAIARIRLARVLGAQGKFDEGLKMLPTDAGELFTGLIEEARGDLFLAMDDLDNARASYKKALDSGQRTGNPGALTMKLNDLNMGTEETS